MNPILETKIQELENAGDYECWYLVKQPTEFDSLCYLVSFLKKYKETDSGKNLQDFIGDELPKLLAEKPSLKISNNYRALRVAAFFGLITMTSSKYDEAIITDTFNQITNRCGGNYENIDLYTDIIQRQIEKMFVSSQIDEAYQGVRQDYRLYPVMLLYKVLIELGHTTGAYKISMTEYRYLVATTKRFEDFLDTLLLINLLRKDTDGVANQLEQYRGKFDNRMIQALKQLSTLIVETDSISLNKEKIDEVAQKVFSFEQNPNIFNTDNYLGFLGSTKSLFELDKFEGTLSDNRIAIKEEMEDPEKDRVNIGSNVLFYGVPGSGKSHKIDEVIGGADYERVVFHPDYTYADFVGQIMPRLKRLENGDEKLSYEFVPGPFTKAMKAAINNPGEMFYLIIEEINRGNAPAIFGDIFQLLDRESDGNGKFHITNYDIAKELFGNDNEETKIYLPSNLSLFATMNTSDQNVFTLDTAFQRRWNLRYVPNDVSAANHADMYVDERQEIKWSEFAEFVNKIILEYNAGMASSEDKQLGAYFITGDELNKEQFAEKVLKYLWDDVYKMDREEFFNPDIKSIGDMIQSYMDAEKQPLKRVMRAEVYKRMMDLTAASPAEADDDSEVFEAKTISDE